MKGMVLKKRSRRYEAFHYWWDVSPQLAKSLDEYDEIDFIKKDTNESCSIPVDKLKKFLTSERKTSRGEGNWGVKVLVDYPNKLAFEPGRGSEDWLFLPVEWHVQSEE